MPGETMAELRKRRLVNWGAQAIAWNGHEWTLGGVAVWEGATLEVFLPGHGWVRGTWHESKEPGCVPTVELSRAMSARFREGAPIRWPLSGIEATPAEIARLEERRLAQTSQHARAKRLTQ